MTKCPKCGGSGVEIVPGYWYDGEEWPERRRECGECGGYGTVASPSPWRDGYSAGRSGHEGPRAGACPEEARGYRVGAAEYDRASR